MRPICALLILSVLGQTQAYADDQPSFPKCTLVGTKDGDPLCGYTLDEYKLVLKADIELRMLRVIRDRNEEKIRLLYEKISNIDLQLDACQEGREAAMDRTAVLTQRLIDLDKKYQDERAKPLISNSIAWTIAAVSSSILAGFITYQIFE